MNRDDAIKLDALIRLGLGRQSKLDEQSQEVYLDDLENEPADVVVRACEQLRRVERPDYDTAFPSVGTILAECRRVKVSLVEERWKALAAAAPKALPPADETPVTREEAKAFMRELRARVEAARRK